MMSLNSLKFVEDVRQTANVDPVERARKNFLARIQEQIEVAEAHARGETLMKKVMEYVTDPESGERKRMEVTKQHRLWWMRGADGSFFVYPRLGAIRFEIVQGKPCVAASDEKAVVKILTSLKQAAEKGELDTAFKAALDKREAKRIAARKAA